MKYRARSVNGGVRLTEAGERRALIVLRRHRSRHLRLRPTDRFVDEFLRSCLRHADEQATVVCSVPTDGNE
ncbi:MAG TPA: hypothetical protein VNJ04_03790 [Gemmatimonadaceae bacterium]|nr:hypothetical protein [Gemmatimonadaceae bacterium]